MWSVGKGCPCRRPGPGEVRSRFQVAFFLVRELVTEDIKFPIGAWSMHPTLSWTYHGFDFFLGVDGVQTTFPNVRSSTDPLNPLTVLTARFTRLGLALAVGQPWFGPLGFVMYSYGKWPFMFVLAMKKSEFSICSLAMFNYRRVSKIDVPTVPENNLSFLL